MVIQVGAIVRQKAQDGALIGPYLCIEQFHIDHSHKYQTSVSLRVLTGPTKGGMMLMLRDRIYPVKTTALIVEKGKISYIRLTNAKSISYPVCKSWINAYRNFKDGKLEVIHLYNKNEKEHLYIVPEEMGLRISRKLGERVVLKIQDVLL